MYFYKPLKEIGKHICQINRKGQFYYKLSMLQTGFTSNTTKNVGPCQPIFILQNLTIVIIIIHLLLLFFVAISPIYLKKQFYFIYSTMIFNFTVL